MQHALDVKHLPLTDDAKAQQWCSHEETLVRAAMLHAVGRNEFVNMAQWLSDVNGEHFHASAMFFTLATDPMMYDQSEKKTTLVKSSDLLAKAKEAVAWTETKLELELEFGLSRLLLTFLELGSPEYDRHMERNVEIARHHFFADDPEKKAASLAGPMLLKLGWTPANPAPSSEDLREGCRVAAELCSAWHQVADLCAEKSAGGAKEEVFRAWGRAAISCLTPHWPEDFRAWILQSVVSRQQLLDSVTVLDFERHSPAFKIHVW